MNIARFFSKCFDRFSSIVIKFTGSTIAFTLAFLTVIIWGITGPIFKYSDTWQLTINTGTSIITFLMVFVLQQSQNKDTLALQLKLNELLAVNDQASNRLINSEDMTQEELDLLKRGYIKMGKSIKNDLDKKTTHSIEEENDNEMDDK